jgi:hypothetical protein
METKHTPGPWIIKNDGNHHRIISKTEPFNTEVADCIQYYLATDVKGLKKKHEALYSDQIVSSNAKLIAASPELLKELDSRKRLLENIFADLERCFGEESKISIDDAVAEICEWRHIIKNAITSSEQAIKKATVQS